MQQAKLDRIVSDACAQQEAIINSLSETDKLRALYNSLVPAEHRSAVTFIQFRRLSLAQQDQRY